ncbi:MAG: regulatory signaling modulator protein AmpE [Gammaproteobacteria bacterium]|nr:regulatory signaling modulator protein AmpE [Gammaproteobacteria bacterium]
MHFIVILTVLMIERFTHFGKKFRSYEYFSKYIGFYEKILAKYQLNSILFMAAVLVPTILIAGILYGILLYSLFGVLAFVFFSFVLLYCLGDDDFSKINAEQIFLKAHKNIFSVIFWAMILGPAGAIFYRLNNKLIDHYKNNSDISKNAQKLEQWLDWIPVRLETFAYALMSHFVHVIKVWLKLLITKPEENESLLQECTKLAMDQKKSANEARELVDRALIVWLVIMALVILL